MRILVYLLTLLMVFAPTYSAYAAGITKGQIIQMGKKGGALVKTAGGKLVKLGKVGHPAVTAGSVVWGFCSKYPKKCKDYAGDAYEIICDLTNCEVTKNQDTSDSDSSNLCPSTHVMRYQIGSFPTSDKAAKSAEEACLIHTPKTIKPYVVETTYAEFNDKNISNCYWKHNYQTMSGRYTKWSNTLYRACVLPEQTQRTQLTQDELKELAKKIAENMDDDDIKNYYNTDYDDITINNNYYYGDDIDNETNIDNQCQNNSCNEISKEIEKDINEKKYDIDDVTPENCTIEENTGKYIACSITINNEEENETPPDDTDQTTDKKEDDDPLSCDTSKFHKKICDWIDWTQDDLEVSAEDKPKIKDLAEDLTIKKDRVRFNAQCPSPKEISITVSGQGFSDHLNYQPFCDLMIKSKPFVIGISGISALLIVAGSLRR